MDLTISKEEARLAKYRQGLQDQIKILQKEIDENNKDSKRQQDYINKLLQLLRATDEEADVKPKKHDAPKVYNDEYEKLKAKRREEERRMYLEKACIKFENQHAINIAHIKDLEQRRNQCKK